MWLILISLSKLIHSFISLLNLGSGYTWPGHIVLKLYPNIFKKLQLFPRKGIILISATNGKTTTAKILTHILSKAGNSVVSNTSGANLLNGIVSALVLDTDFFGNAKSDYAVFEVDEFVLPRLLEKNSPDLLVLLNLSRDQLDRYGETDTILARWAESISALPQKGRLLLPSDEPVFTPLGKGFKGSVSLFEAYSLEVENPGLSGIFNRKNLGAALKVSELLGINLDVALQSLSDFELAWGRGEIVDYKKVSWKFLLAKNPASFNFNLQHILEGYPDYLGSPVLVDLNDNIPDGKDVSWIYDIDTQLLVDVLKDRKTYVTGKRAYDMSVRLFYSGLTIDSQNIFTKPLEAVEFICKHSVGKKLIVLPNYTAMLELRKIMKGKSIL